MSAGTMLLTITAIFVYCGILQRVLDRMHMTDRQALLLIAVMLAGTFLPDISFGVVRINIGGAIIPLGVCVYLYMKADLRTERIRSVIGTVLTAAGIYLITAFFPSEPERMMIDPMWVYGLIGGLLSWLLGRSRRNAFICGVTGIILADLLTGIIAKGQGYEGQIVLGGGGIADAAVISGVFGVLICEGAGELIERVSRLRRKTGGRVQR